MLVMLPGLSETWFFVTPGGSYDAVVLWRADLGIARQLATWFRSMTCTR